MKILHEVEGDDFVCEVVGCGRIANLYVTDFDGESGYICKQCNDEDNLAQSKETP